MKTLRKIALMTIVMLMLAIPALATQQGEYRDIISIGAELTPEQKQVMLLELGYEEGVELIETTNEEEHKYLGGIIPTEKIGTQTLSNARIVFQPEGTGLSVEVSDKINYITPELYENALITAGITDASVVVTAPFSVTGTGALTGIMKAYESSTGEVINEDVKKIANEELVVTSELSNQIGGEQSSELVNEIKTEFDKNKPQSEQEVREVVINIASNNNIELTPQQQEQLVKLFDKMRQVDIDWGKVTENLQKAGVKVGEVIQNEELQAKLKETGQTLEQYVASGQAEELLGSAKEKLQNFIDSGQAEEMLGTAKDKAQEFAKSEEGQNVTKSLVQLVKDIFAAIGNFFINLFGKRK